MNKTKRGGFVVILFILIVVGILLFFLSIYAIKKNKPHITETIAVVVSIIGMVVGGYQLILPEEDRIVTDQSIKESFNDIHIGDISLFGWVNKDPVTETSSNALEGTKPLQTSTNKDKAELVYLYNQPYYECSYPNAYKAYIEDNHNYIAFSGQPQRNGGVYVDKSKRMEVNYTLSYKLNGKPQRVRGILQITATHNPEVYYEFLDENDNLLYKSPTISKATEPISFDFTIEYVEVLTIRINHTDKAHGECKSMIKDLAVIY